ncbi:hypothetical protein [Streptomyces sp. NPDC006551]|uniref:hypothetical protein n=1 Tax=Streptomyces sp. NPDC006551 TaxID=3157178 RepID=UPI0033AD7A09
MFRLSPRSWLILAASAATLLVLMGLLSFPSLTSALTSAWPATAGRPALPAPPLPDVPLPGGGTARLSQCGVDDGPRPPARGEGERGSDPQLIDGGWEAVGAGPKTPGRNRFTVHLAVRTVDRPLLLDAPLSGGRVELDIYGPHGQGRRASARGLTATVVDDGPGRKPLQPPASGKFRVDPGESLLVDVELPAAAVCPGHTLRDVGSCSPELTNDAADCPVLVVTLSDPAIRAHRAAVTGQSPERLSERLVMVSLEPEMSET